MWLRRHDLRNLGDTMDVKFLKAHTVQLTSSSAQTYPAGWTGPYTRDDLDDLIEARVVSPVASPEAPAPMLTTGEQKALKVVAAQVIAAQKELAETDFTKLTKVQLAEIAAQFGIDGIAAMKKETLVEAVEAAVEAGLAELEATA